MGYLRGELEPIFHLSRAFHDFSEYKAALRSSYKHQIDANIKKFNHFNFQVEHFFTAEAIGAQFTDDLYQLYLNVWAKAKEKLECFSVDFFRQLPQILPGQVTLTLIKDQQKPIAFAIGITEESIYHNLYIGLDYHYAERADLYFNLFYHELAAVFPLKKSKIFLGQTSAAFKSRLGAYANARFFWVKPLNPLFRFIFQTFSSLIFPKIPAHPPKQVFKQNS